MSSKTFGLLAASAILVVVTGAAISLRAAETAPAPKPAPAKPADAATAKATATPAMTVVPTHGGPAAPNSVEPAAPAGPAGQAEMPETVFDAGTVERGTDVSHAFVIENLGEHPLTVDAKPG